MIFYDQIGCGRSWIEKPSDFWTVELFVGEVQAVRAALDLECVHLFGSSWGGMLAMEIDAPALITAGAHDEFTPMQAEALHSRIRDSELVTVEDASHMQFVEEPERYRELVAAFLDRVERE